MFNLIKYELQGIYKQILGVMIVMLVLSLLLYSRIGTWQDASIISLAVLITMSALIWSFIVSIKIYSKYMYDDSGYLMFTLPKTGYSILGSRILIAVLDLWVTLGMSFLILKGILNKVITNQVIREQLKTSLRTITTSDIFFMIVMFTFTWIFTMMLIYFCITLSKIVLNRKKIGKFGSFITFIIFTIVLGNFTPWLQKTFPQSIDFFANKGNMSLGAYNSTIGSINIATMLFEIALVVGFFFSVSYFIDKKLEL